MKNERVGGTATSSPTTFREDDVWLSRLTLDARRRNITVSAWLRLAVRRMLRRAT